VTRVETTEALLSVQIGGEKNLLDAFSIDMRADDNGFTLKWAGHHLPIDGKYSSALTIHTFHSDGDEPELAFRMTGEYDTNLAENNISLSFDSLSETRSEISARMNGTLALNKARKAFKLDFDSISVVNGYGSQQYAMSYEYTPLEAIDFVERNPVMLLSLSKSELEDILSEITGNIDALFGFGSP
jgi:hypothetical protein